MSGYTISGVYTINPDEGTPFEVSVLVVLKLSSNTAYNNCRFIVIWILTAMDGLSSRGERMDQLTSIVIGLTRKVLVISMENSGWD